jgi:plasmid stabilization system protein ParE
MRSVEFHPEAAAEFLAAVQFYEAQAEKLGFDFVSAVQRAAERIVEYPNSGAPFGRRLRRVLIPGFPYGLIYRVERERLFVVSVMHLHRRPGYWRSRL